MNIYIFFLKLSYLYFFFKIKLRCIFVIIPKIFIKKLKIFFLGGFFYSLFIGFVFIFYYLIFDLISWNNLVFSPRYKNNSNFFVYFEDHILYAEFFQSNKGKDTFKKDFPGNHRRTYRGMSKRMRARSDFFFNHRNHFVFDRIQRLSTLNSRFSIYKNKQFPVISHRWLLWHHNKYEANVAKKILYPPKPSGRFGNIRKGFSFCSTPELLKRLPMLYNKITVDQDIYTYWFWNRSIYNNNLSKYKLYNPDLLPLNTMFLTKNGTRESAILRLNRIFFFIDLKVLEVSLHNPGFFVLKEKHDIAVMALNNPLFLRNFENFFNLNFKTYITQLRLSGLEESVINSILFEMYKSKPRFYVPYSSRFIFTNIYPLRSSDIFTPVRIRDLNYIVDSYIAQKQPTMMYIQQFANRYKK
jgi:hypothetical protein